MSDDDPRKATLARDIEVFSSISSEQIQPYQQDILDCIRSEKPLVIGIDYSRTESKAVIHLVGNSSGIVIVDEVEPLVDAKLMDIIDTYGSPTGRQHTEHQGMMVINLEKSLRKLRLDPMVDALEPLHPEEHGMVSKNGKLVKRHHPIPKTPRSPKQRRR